MLLGMQVEMALQILVAVFGWRLRMHMLRSRCL
jgi:hypothetical protein